MNVKYKFNFMYYSLGNYYPRKSRKNHNYYVYKSTTYWDKEAKRRRKSSVYIGTLDREKGLTKRKEKTVFKGVIKQYGTAAMLNLVMEDITYSKSISKASFFNIERSGSGPYWTKYNF